MSFSKVLGGSAIIAGTAIGAGMLALPIVSAAGGFWPSFAIYALCWLFSLSTGLLFAEICLWLPKQANIISMSKHLLGPVGQLASWILYLFLFYCLTIAYVSGGGDFLNSITNQWIPRKLSVVLFTFVFSLFVYIGTKAIDRINFILMIGLVLSYFGFVIIGFDQVRFEALKFHNVSAALTALPVLFTSFSYQGTVPSLASYLEYNPKKIRVAIIIGSTVPFVVYVFWQMLILGLIPLEGPYGLLATKSASGMAVEPLQHLFPNSPIFFLGQLLGAFALTTSFLGVSLGLMDFLADGLQVKKTKLNKLWLCLLIFVPAVFISLTNPSIFLAALGYAGGIGCALLLGLFPVLMIWAGRYKLGYPLNHQMLPGGRPILSVLILFIFFELFVGFLSQI